jgi:uncharacterized damage-inducible protein DinB
MIDARTLAYDFWANGETLTSIERAPGAPEKARAIAAHAVATLFLWHGRVSGVDHAVAVWPEWTLPQIRERLAAAEPLWREMVADSDASRVVSYTNSKGEVFRSSVGDICTHVMFHGAYHRGQVATVLREAGFEPAYTDYIHATRKGLLS